MGWKAGIWFLSIAVFLVFVGTAFYAFVIEQTPMSKQGLSILAALALLVPQLFLNETKEDRELWELKKELKRTDLLIKQRALEAQLSEVRSHEK